MSMVSYLFYHVACSTCAFVAQQLQALALALAFLPYSALYLLYLLKVVDMGVVKVVLKSGRILLP